MKLYTIDTGYFNLDGGAMFGVVPKVLWSRTNPADDNNLCPWAMRSLLIEDGKRLILIDNGIGNKQDDKFLRHYYLHGDDTLRKSLNKHGFSEDDITDVFLTHLHFDHCGGSVKWNNDKTDFEMVFKNAKYWSNQDHWSHALNSNYREKASLMRGCLHCSVFQKERFVNQDMLWASDLFLNGLIPAPLNSSPQQHICILPMKRNVKLIHRGGRKSWCWVEGQTEIVKELNLIIAVFKQYTA